MNPNVAPANPTPSARSGALSLLFFGIAFLTAVDFGALHGRLHGTSEWMLMLLLTGVASGAAGLFGSAPGRTPSAGSRSSAPRLAVTMAAATLVPLLLARTVSIGPVAVALAFALAAVGADRLQVPHPISRTLLGLLLATAVAWGLAGGGVGEGVATGLSLGAALVLRLRDARQEDEPAGRFLVVFSAGVVVLWVLRELVLPWHGVHGLLRTVLLVAGSAAGMEGTQRAARWLGQIDPYSRYVSSIGVLLALAVLMRLHDPSAQKTLLLAAIIAGEFIGAVVLGVLHSRDAEGSPPGGTGASVLCVLPLPDRRVGAAIETRPVR